MSFVVIAHNEAAGIEQALHSILAQEGVDDREVIVVDDGSSDGTAELVAAAAARCPRVRLVRLERNRGRGFARDVGIRLARGQVIATIDADVILPPDWSSQCLGALAVADAVGGTAVPDGDVAYICARFGLKARIVPHTTNATGSNAAYRRELFERIAFDRALRDGEDVAFNHALRAIGAHVQTIPGLVAEHRESKGFAETLAWLFQSGRGASRQLYRYRELRRPDLAFAGWLLSGAGAAVWLYRGHRAAGCVPVVYLGTAAAAHVLSAFVWDRRDGHRLLAAMVVDMALLSAYFAGRLAGIPRATRAPREPRP
ncbi:MAG: glycosyltransferase family 2 protein [Solirubrobacterales bacterium]|nr:glycosyltransferase family 2 protein [Solirubrobacterales bacterium]